MQTHLFILISLIISLSNQSLSPHIHRILQSIGLDFYNLQPINTPTSFQQFKSFQNKQYFSKEQQTFRMLIFQQNSKSIQTHNKGTIQIFSNSTEIIQTTYLMNINQFSDLTQKQFRQIYTKTYLTSNAVVQKSQLVISAYLNPFSTSRVPSFAQPSFIPSKQPFNQLKEILLDQQIDKIIRESEQLKYYSQIELDSSINQLKNKISQSSIDYKIKQDNMINNLRFLQSQNSAQIIQIDWTKYSGSIKYQGQCGSCYAFAATDALSAMNAIYKFGFNVPLSVQQVIDCANKGLTYGCSGGFIEGAYAYMQTIGLTTDFQYKYKGKQQNCKVDKGNFKISSFKTLQQGSCNTLIEQLKKKPIAIGIAGYRLRFYSSGIFDDCNSYIDHAVLLVGYKTNVGWKIKNTWGLKWGMNGYAWIKDGNNCGICQNAISASIMELKP